MAKCRMCGAEFPYGTPKCPRCGAAQAPANFAPQAPPKQPPWLLFAGLIGCFVCICPIGAAILFPVFQQARVAAHATLAVSSAKVVALGVAMYTNDCDDSFPPSFSKEWITAGLAPYLAQKPDEQQLRLGQKQIDYVRIAEGYVWNTNLANQPVNNLADPAHTWLLHNSEKDIGGMYEVAFADWHAQRVTEENLSKATSAPIKLEPEGGDTSSGSSTEDQKKVKFNGSSPSQSP